MPRDAFGNPIDEAAAPTLPGLPSPEPSRSPRRGPRPGAVVAAAVALVVVGAGVALVGLSGAPQTSTAAPAQTLAVESPRATAQTPAPDPQEKPAVARRPPRGLQEGSMLRRDNFAWAVREIRRRAKGRPRTIRVDAERVSIQTVLRDSRLRQSIATWDGTVTVLATSPPIGDVGSFAWNAIDRSAPQRIVRAATGRARVPASRFDYAALLDVGGLQWSAFVKTGDAFVAAPGGAIRRQISNG